MAWHSPALPLNPLADVQPVLDQLSARFPNACGSRVEGNQVAVSVDRGRLREVCQFLRDTSGLEFDLLAAETAVDWVDWLDVVYLVRSTKLRHELAFTVQVDHDDAAVPSLAGVWGAAIWMERECYDLLGIRFADHPDLRRVLTWDEFEGHPLRKDFGLGGDRGIAYNQVPPGFKKVGEE